jgi:hypothetical protein
MSNTNLNTILPFTISSFQRCSRHDVKIYEVRFTLIRFCRPPPYFGTILILIGAHEFCSKINIFGAICALELVQN